MPSRVHFRARFREMLRDVASSGMLSSPPSSERDAFQLYCLFFFFFVFFDSHHHLLQFFSNSPTTTTRNPQVMRKKLPSPP
jgi:hypothetical protein